MPKLSQIATGGTLVTGTQFVAVTGGAVDNLYTIDQIKSFSLVPASPVNSVQYNNASALGGFGIYNSSTHTLTLDAADSASPNPQILQFQNVLNGTSNTAGALGTINSSLSTGIGLPGFLNFNTGFVGYDVGKTITISNASPAVCTSSTAHNLFGNQCILLQTTGTLPAPLQPLTQYFVQGPTSSTTFDLATSFNGTLINTTTAGSGTHSYVPGGVITGLQNVTLGSGTCTLFLCALAGGVVDGMVVQFQSSGTLPTGISANTNYNVIAAGWPGASGGIQGFGVTLTQNGTNPITASGGTGTLTYQIQGNIQNNPILGTGFVFGSINQVGSDGSAFLNLKQIWNSDQTTSAFTPLHNLSDCLLGLTINNLRKSAGASSTHLKCYEQATNQNTFNINSNYNGTTSTWQLGPTVFTNTGPCIEFHNANTSSDTTLGLIGPPFLFANRTTDSVFQGNGTPIGVQLGLDGVNGIASFYHQTATSPAGIRAYNTTDNVFGAPTNYERGVFDWTVSGNTLVVGTQKGGTGTARGMNLDAAGITAVLRNSANFIISNNGTANTAVFTMGGYSSLRLAGSTVGFSNNPLEWSSTADAQGTADLSLNRVASGVLSIGKTNGGGGNATTDGWFNYGGQTRVTSDVTFTSTVTLATVTGLSVNVQAGRTYAFEAHLSWTDAAAGGIQAAISGTATATNIIYDGWTVDSAANGVKGNTQATALGTAVGSTVTTGTAGFTEIKGIITVNAAGTLLVQAAQNTSNATATTIKRGSYFIVQDMP